MKINFFSIITFSLFSFTYSNDTPIINFLSIGDWGGYNLGSYHQTNILSVSKQMINYTNYNNYNAIINTGDNFYYCGIQNLEDPNIDADYINLFKSIQLPWYNSLGNHDYGYNVSAQLLLNNIIPNWNLPNNYYYKTFNQDNLLLYLIVLDTSPCVQDYRNTDNSKWVPCGEKFPTCNPYNNNIPCNFHNNIISQNCNQQYLWLSNLLNTIKTQKLTSSYNIKVIVSGHHPINQIDVEDFESLIDDDIVDMYINGHTHIMAAYSINNKNKYFTNGAGSMVSQYSQIDTENYSWYLKQSGFMTISIYNDYIHIQFINNDGNSVYDYKLYSTFDKSNYILTDSLSSCSSPDSIATDLQLQLTPPNPTINSKYVLDSTYTLTETVTGGSANYYVTLSGFPIVNQKNDLCKDLQNGPTPCPLNKGPIKSQINGVIPSNTPHGSYNTKITWTNSNNQEILCIQFDFTI